MRKGDGMRMVELKGMGMRCSAVGFGCASMLGRVGRKASLGALGAAFDAGVDFFDTARSYGYGEAEGLLGEFLRGRREKVVVATKFGIVPVPGSALKRAVKPMARAVLGVAPGLRRVVRGRLEAQSSGGHFGVAAMRDSLEASLRALRTEYVDLLWLHEPARSVLEQDDLFDAMEGLVRQGKVRRYGVSGEAEVVGAALGRGIRAVQFRCDVVAGGMQERLSVAEDVVAVGNHPFGGAQGAARCREMLASIARDATTPQMVREKLREGGDGLLADVVLNVVAVEKGVQVVVASMMQVEHVRANVAAMEGSRFGAEELAWLRQAIVGKCGERTA